MSGQTDSQVQHGVDVLPLTSDQQEALAALKGFVQEGKAKCFILEGYAGTGKTFLVRRFVNWLEANQMRVLLAAPTGRAGKVLANKTGYPAGTIHRSIYAMDKLLTRRDGTDGFKFYYGLKLVAQDSRPRVIVVDESSMVSDRADDEKFFGFGSGRLLKDLMDFSAANDGWAGCQVVFVGDPAQLPPVGMETSPALDAEYLRKEFGVRSRTATLRQVVRQSEDSAILKAASQIREDIVSGRENRLEIVPDGKEIKSLEPSQVCDLWETLLSGEQKHRIAPPLVCVTYSNRQALAYNASVRARLHPDGDGFHPVRQGDYLMVVANNRMTGLWNGELARVLDAEQASEARTVRCHTRDGIKEVGLVFRRVQIAVPEEGNPSTTPRVITSTMLENVLYSKMRDITDDEQIGLYVDFKNRNRQLKEGSEEFALALAADPYFNALRVKFGYAVTCHKAQGGEWPSAVVVFDNARTHTEQLRWTYTAITRAKKTLYGVGFPRSGMLNWPSEESQGLEMDGECVDNESTQAPARVNSDLAAFHQAGFPCELDWMAEIHFAAVEEWRRDGIEIGKVDPQPAKWFVRYQLAKAGQQIQVQIAFNKRMKTVLVDVRSLTSPIHAGLLEACRGGFERAKVKVERAQLPAGPVELRELLEEHVKPIVARLGGEVQRVESFPYRERYRIRSAGGGVAVLDFCYDGRRRFCRRPEIQLDTTDHGFAELIIEGIKQ